MWSFYSGEEWSKSPAFPIDFKRLQQQINHGYTPPTEWPKHLTDKKLEVEARLDVKTDELEELQRRPEMINELIQAQDEIRMLKYGPLGAGMVRNQVLANIDGQIVVVNEDGILVIQDERSPYNGMAVTDFRQLSATWVKTIREKEKGMLKQRQAAAKAAGQPIPKRIANRIGRMTIKREVLPKWPKGEKNYLQPEPE